MCCTNICCVAALPQTLGKHFYFMLTGWEEGSMGCMLRSGELRPFQSGPGHIARKTVSRLLGAESESVFQSNLLALPIPYTGSSNPSCFPGVHHVLHTSLSCTVPSGWNTSLPSAPGAVCKDGVQWHTLVYPGQLQNLLGSYC